MTIYLVCAFLTCIEQHVTFSWIIWHGIGYENNHGGIIIDVDGLFSLEGSQKVLYVHLLCMVWTASKDRNRRCLEGVSVARHKLKYSCLSNLFSSFFFLSVGVIILM